MNRQQRRQAQREQVKKGAMSVAVKLEHATAHPMLNVWYENRLVKIQIAQPGWVNQWELPLDYAEVFLTEFQDAIRAGKSGLEVFRQPSSSLITP